MLRRLCGGNDYQLSLDAAGVECRERYETSINTWRGRNSIDDSSHTVVGCSLVREKKKNNLVRYLDRLNIKKLKYRRMSEWGGRGRIKNGRLDNGKSKKNFKGKCDEVANVGVMEGVVRGCSSNCYGAHNEESDICRNNGRLWEFLDYKINGKLLSAIVAFGVVDAEGRNNLESQLDHLEKEGGINKKVGRMV